jgi:hypothetical protein
MQLLHRVVLGRELRVLVSCPTLITSSLIKDFIVSTKFFIFFSDLLTLILLILLSSESWSISSIPIWVYVKPGLVEKAGTQGTPSSLFLVLNNIR